MAESGKEAESAKDEKPEVQIRVTDATNRLVRRFKAPARLGVNRIAWDLLSDPYKQPPSGDNVSPFDPGEPTGPEVGPGTYTISMTFGKSEVSQKVNVVADPRSRNTPEDWQRRADTLAKAGALNDQVVGAIWRIRDARADIDAVQKKAREAAERAGEKDKKKIEDLPIVKDGEKVKEGLTTLEKRLWAPPETKGFTAGEEVLNAVNLPIFFILSSWDAPNPNHLDHLRLGEEKVKAILPEVDKYFGAEVAGYTAKVREAGIGLLSGR